jgi:hypothetical protein
MAAVAVCKFFEDIKDSDVEKFKEWRCLSCKRKALFPQYQYMCFCDAKQLVCKSCYQMFPDFDWAASFGPDQLSRRMPRVWFV